jgi:hypothetical protein
MDDHEEVILTPNLWIVGYTIQTTKCKSGFEDNGSMLLFSLPKTDAVLKAMADFNNGGLVRAIEYAEIVKRLRHEMYLTRNERESENGKGVRNGSRKIV